MFIRLTSCMTDSEVVININQISYFRSDLSDFRRTYVHLNSGTTIGVLEDLETVMFRILEVSPR